MPSEKTKGRGFDRDLPKKMYTYFLHFDDASGAPSFGKFAASVGLLPEDIEKFREKTKFDCAYRACNEIRRDYLIDRALCRRFDPSFVKFLLSTEFGMGEESQPDRDLAVTFEVVK